MTDQTLNRRAFFAKLDDGTWGIRVVGDEPELGSVLTVTRRDQSTSAVTVTEIASAYDAGFLCRFVEATPDRPAPAARKPRAFDPTAEQQHALDIFRTGSSLAIEAGAGTGKTSSLILLAEDADSRGKRGQYVAFNKKIVVESAGKFPASVNCDTAHSLAYRAVGTPFSRRMNSGARVKSHELARILKINPVKVTRHTGEAKTLSPEFLAGIAMKTIRNFCQSADAVITSRHVPHTEGLDAPPTAERPMSYAVNDAVAEALEPALKRAWDDLCRYEGALPFTISTAMMVFLKLWHLSRPRINADYILFDEAQDASPVMVAVVAAQTHAQLVFVGDSNQSIYSFTGAVNALEQVPAANRAMLTQSFRFGPAVAEVANEILATLPTTMRLTGTLEIASRVEPVAEPRVILTRTNATAIREVMTAITNEQRPFLVGGGSDITAFCRAARDLQDGRRTDHPELACFSRWSEVKDYVDHDQQGDDLRLMVTLIDEFGVQRILDAVDGCAKEADADVIVSTAHKAKGCEWDSVKLGGDFPDRDKMGDEERRLLYVAVTRAKLELDVTAVAFFAPEAAESFQDGPGGESGGSTLPNLSKALVGREVLA